jgi:hypothetical protein
MGGPRCVKHRGAHLFRLGEDLLLPLRRMSGFHQLSFKTPSRLASARLSLDMILCVGGADQRAAWQRSTLDPHRDLASGKVIRSCSVASFDLLTKIDPADTLRPRRLLAYRNHMIRSKSLPFAGAALPDASAGAALESIGHEPDRRQSSEVTSSPGASL